MTNDDDDINSLVSLAHVRLRGAQRRPDVSVHEIRRCHRETIAALGQYSGKWQHPTRYHELGLADARYLRQHHQAMTTWWAMKALSTRIGEEGNSRRAYRQLVRQARHEFKQALSVMTSLFDGVHASYVREMTVLGDELRRTRFYRSLN